ncbi:hypothetical protein BV902_12750 [Sphingobacterium sp. B29]|uniref:hypothetical protein n=1 Tax=Sphingobacterium sp. B29 TaxID=1933220 RepID=UPI0009580C9A|nr:hypothetical protein [Sphingobacterium sp. B29]APU97111.1 hypothetical protein BV902_12750 [Sphingobacterium sp. B29]
MDDIIIPTYIINGSQNANCFETILSQFEGKDEFDVKIFSVAKEQTEDLMYWKAVRKVIEIAINNDEDVILICDENHVFTSFYAKEQLISSIYEAHHLQASILLGGVNGDFRNLLPLKSRISWLEAFSQSNFIMIFRSLYGKFLNESFCSTDNFFQKLSSLTSNKFVMFPPISRFNQDNIKYKYEDASLQLFLRNSLESSIARINKIHEIYHNICLNGGKISS